ncbi:MAG TPA: DUF2721 domain-containing protein [Anaeromyxobacteraceae bacterium]|nr:DUF2721 domain-containing protein [Anaeromyxobacteraceae bacterium]
MAADPVVDVAHVIQLAIAPVFLLTAVGTLLSVLSTRLARVVDRARVLRDRLATRTGAERERVTSELRLLKRRRRRVNLAITCGVSAALFVCLLIVVAFAGAFLHASVSKVLATLFVLAMLALVGALSTFLSEIFLATRSVDLEES